MPKETMAGTNVNKVRAQNQASAAGNSDVEFASDTDAQKVRQQNQKSAAKKK
ncbi:gamma-type small acid-soluble spore protein [Microaerobacter geothermalis]|uniref:gamma-type small acid-soluble spore protein n=1 Tax=Microaerobacter geothermalis TaxID=674972 RepID=UPI001F44DD10|nr:gamma-type small acid-soluble spore protein [Microaerobacter geothermalis]MCF6093766.1 gamma-type small acid-soluble spore protein [Microaerobacter geothermalis]